MSGKTEIIEYDMWRLLPVDSATILHENNVTNEIFSHWMEKVKKVNCRRFIWLEFSFPGRAGFPTWCYKHEELNKGKAQIIFSAFMDIPLNEIDDVIKQYKNQ